MTNPYSICLFFALAVTLALMPAQTCLAIGDTVDWPQIARQDIAFFHHEVETNHPGPVNSLDPDFSKREKTAFRLATQRASTIDGFAGYFWLLKAYTASFDDRHVFFREKDGAPSLESRWPGFLTRFSGEHTQTLAVSARDVAIPVGSRLVSCDGIKASDMAQSHVGDFFPAWALASQRYALGYHLFLDQGNPFIGRAKRCLFDVNGTTQAITLNWRSLSENDRKSIIATATSSHVPPIELRQLKDRSWWLSLASFDPFEADNKARLESTIASLKQNRGEIIESPRLVIDLRGNTGGLSTWAETVTNVIWGDHATDSLPANRVIDWRVSVSNYEEVRARLHLIELPEGARKEVKKEIQGLHEALQSHRPLWREVDTRFARRNHDADSLKLSMPIFVLTDRQCFSSCLDAVYMFRTLGAIHVGHETGADTAYLDQRVFTAPTTPSGLATLSLPMKVYRDKDRMPNQPWAPAYLYDGDTSNTQRLEHWVATLPTDRQGVHGTEYAP